MPIQHTAGAPLVGVDKSCTARTDKACTYTCADGHQDSQSSLDWNDDGYSGSTISCVGVSVGPGKPVQSEFKDQLGAPAAVTCDPLPCAPKLIDHTTDPSGKTHCSGNTGDSCTLSAPYPQPVPDSHIDYTCAAGYTASQLTRTISCRPDQAKQSAFDEPIKTPPASKFPLGADGTDLWDYCPRESSLATVCSALGPCCRC